MLVGGVHAALTKELLPAGTSGALALTQPELMKPVSGVALGELTLISFVGFFLFGFLFVLPPLPT
jgi:hypothetical protein